MKKDKTLREHLLYLLNGGGAHLDFDSVIAALPRRLRGRKPKGAPHTPWQLFEHLRICQWDILDFCRNQNYKELPFEDYWPKTAAPPSDAAWNRSLKAFRADLRAMKKLVANPKTNLYARIPHGNGQTILREALLVADHNAYHLGQLVLLRRLLASWKAD